MLELHLLRRAGWNAESENVRLAAVKEKFLRNLDVINSSYHLYILNYSTTQNWAAYDSVCKICTFLREAGVRFGKLTLTGDMHRPNHNTSVSSAAVADEAMEVDAIRQAATKKCTVCEADFERKKPSATTDRSSEF